MAVNNLANSVACGDDVSDRFHKLRELVCTRCRWRFDLDGQVPCVIPKAVIGVIYSKLQDSTTCRGKSESAANAERAAIIDPGEEGPVWQRAVDLAALKDLLVDFRRIPIAIHVTKIPMIYSPLPCDLSNVILFTLANQNGRRLPALC